MQLQKNQMWLAMEATYPNEHQKTQYELLIWREEKRLGLSYFTSN